MLERYRAKLRTMAVPILIAFDRVCRRRVGCDGLLVMTAFLPQIAETSVEWPDAGELGAADPEAVAVWEKSMESTFRATVDVADRLVSRCAR